MKKSTMFFVLSLLSLFGVISSALFTYLNAINMNTLFVFLGIILMLLFWILTMFLIGRIVEEEFNEEFNKRK
ncbi:MAG: hypothetical protein WC932_06280 [archaeon]|jgi:hypothetical protein